MQFHLNGFRTGDPRIVADAETTGQLSADAVDVLIVGSGPTGLTLASQLSAFPEIRTRIIEQKPGPLTLGQADGIACRTMEMFQAFGFADRVLAESCGINETVFWKPDPARPGTIIRAGRVQDVEDGLSEMPHVILNQARVHDFYLELMQQSAAKLVPDYSCHLIGLSVDCSSPHPVAAYLEHRTPGEDPRREAVHARYVVGCDGARSAVRRLAGLTLRGDSANHAWGVMDILAVTDFPDVRLKAVIHSAEAGNILIIPREGGYLVRLYIELSKLGEGERVSDKKIGVEDLIAAAQRILHPYTLEVKEVAWWSVYEIGQRLCDRFDNFDAGSPQIPPTVFIAGDACHTHSPKAGQGMNVSMQDAFNLGWKLAAVIKGEAPPALLATYSDERRAVAQELIDFDRDFARMFSARADEKGGTDGVDPAEFQRYFVRQGRFTAGTATQYRPSQIIADPGHQQLARGFVVGTRFHSAPVVRVADAKPMELGHCMTADGRWRLFLFADGGDPFASGSSISRLCDFLADDPRSPVVRYTPDSADSDSIIDVRAIFQQGHRELAIEKAHPLLMPRKGKYGLIDYEKMFCRDAARSDIFDLRGIRREGCIVVVRPDQYISHVLPLTEDVELASFFDSVMLKQGYVATGDTQRHYLRANAS